MFEAASLRDGPYIYFIHGNPPSPSHYIKLCAIRLLESSRKTKLLVNYTISHLGNPNGIGFGSLSRLEQRHYSLKGLGFGEMVQ